MYGFRLLSHVTNKALFLQKSVHENKVLKGLLVFLSSLLFGIAFYHITHDWDLPLSYFYAASVLLGDLYLVPEDTVAFSEVFTLLYFLWGCVLMASALAISAQTLIEKAVQIAAEERKRIVLASKETERLLEKQRRERQRRLRRNRRISRDRERDKERERGRERDKENERERDCPVEITPSEGSVKSDKHSPVSRSWTSGWWGSGYQHRSRTDERERDSPDRAERESVVDEEEADANDEGLSTRSMQGSTRAVGPTLTFYDQIVLAIDDFFLSIGWDYHRSKYLALSFILVWFGVGIVYGLFFEGWALDRAVYFSASAITAAGISPPECEGDDPAFCEVGTARSLMLGTYIIVGVPIFGYSLEQFAEYLLEQVVRANELKLMMNPIKKSEFQYVLSLRKGVIPEQSVDDFDECTTPMSSKTQTFSRRSFSRAPSTAGSTFIPGGSRDRERERDNSETGPEHLRLNFGEFVVLELLRLKKITKTDLDYIKSIYDVLNREQEKTTFSTSVPMSMPGISLSTKEKDRDPAERRASVIQSTVMLEPIAEEDGNESWTSLRGSTDFDSFRSNLERERAVSNAEMARDEDQGTIAEDNVDIEAAESDSAKYSLSLDKLFTMNLSPMERSSSPLALNLDAVIGKSESLDDNEPPSFLRDIDEEDQDHFSMQYNKLLLPAMHQLQIQSDFFSKNADLEDLPEEEAEYLLSKQNMFSPELPSVSSRLSNTYDASDEDEDYNSVYDDEEYSENHSERIPFFSQFRSFSSDKYRERDLSRSSFGHNFS